MTHSLSSLVPLSLALQTTAALAQCYYPDGNFTTADFKCENSDLCCPLNWQCLSNGLAAGNEGMGVCDNGKFCCDGDHIRGCCEGNLVNGTDYLDLGEDTVVATILPALGSAPAASTGAPTSVAASSAATTQASTSTAAPPANTCPCTAV